MRHGIRDAFAPPTDLSSLVLTAPSRSSLKARVVCPVSCAPLAGGVLEIEDGIVVDLHQHPHERTIDLGNVAVIPGLVNCHTHLEFSNLSHPLGPAQPFAAWIGSVVAERRRRRSHFDPTTTTDRSEPDPIARGLEECFRAGCSVVADIVTGTLNQVDNRPAIVEAMHQQRLLSFHELIAPLPSGVAAALSGADVYFREVQSAGLQEAAGLSPHAPYTVTSGLLSEAVERAVRKQHPIAMHVAETLEEIELLQDRSGPLAEMLQRIGQWDPAALGARSAWDVLQVLNRAPQALIIHGNYLSDDELRFLGEHPGMSLIYCPRTHAYFGHSPYPLERALALGVNVALGTDSRASNPDLKLWEEAKAVASRFPDLEPATILYLATRNGARALGQSERHGVIEAGRPADLCCIQLDDSIGDPLRGSLAPSAVVTGVLHAGEWLLRPAGLEG